MSKVSLELSPKKDNAGVPACLKQRAKSDKFDASYHSVAHVTDVIKEELLARLNSKLFPKEESFAMPGWESRHAKDIGYIKALKEILELLP